MLSISPVPLIRLHETPITLLPYNPKGSQASQDKYTSLSFHCGVGKYPSPALFSLLAPVTLRLNLSVFAP